MRFFRRHLSDLPTISRRGTFETCRHPVAPRQNEDAGIVPENVETMGPDAWQLQSITVLGTPIGSPQYIEDKMDERISKEREGWMAIPTVPDLQCTWQLLVQTTPRALRAPEAWQTHAGWSKCTLHVECPPRDREFIQGQCPKSEGPKINCVRCAQPSGGRSRRDSEKHTNPEGNMSR